jgi:hypothetical protein
VGSYEASGRVAGWRRGHPQNLWVDCRLLP